MHKKHLVKCSISSHLKLQYILNVYMFTTRYFSEFALLFTKLICRLVWIFMHDKLYTFAVTLKY